MRVKSVELIQLKSYDHEVIELSPSITLLVGPNNSGKSTIIRSLLNLQYSNTFSKTDVRATHDFSKIHADIVDVSPKENLRFTKLNQAQEHKQDESFKVIWHNPLRSDIVEEYLYTNLRYVVEVDERGIVKTKDQRGNHVELNDFKRFSDQEDQDNFIYPFLSKRKIEHYRYESNKTQAFKVDESLRNLAVKIQKLTNSSHPRSQEFNARCNDILGFAVGVIPIEQESISGIEPGIYVTDTIMIPMRHMGEGVANVAGALATLLSENGKLYLMEELENDIHPEALKKLLSLILEKANSNQFVVSTHSNIVLKYLGSDPNAIIYSTSWRPFFRKAEDRIPTTKITRIDDDPSGRLKLLTDLGYDLADVGLHEGFLLFEESSAERIIRDFLIPNFTPKLLNKVRTVAAQGTSDIEPRFIDFHRLFVFIHGQPAYSKKAWVIADGDQPGKEVINKLKARFSSWPNDHFLNFGKENFEEYYPSRFSEEISRVLAIGDKRQRRAAKKDLLDEVISWCIEHKEESVSEISISAAEVIEILKAIERVMVKKDVHS